MHELGEQPASHAYGNGAFDHDCDAWTSIESDSVNGALKEGRVDSFIWQKRCWYRYEEMSGSGETSRICCTSHGRVVCEFWLDRIHTLLGYVKSDDVVMIRERGDELHSDIPNAEHSNEWRLGLSYRGRALVSSIVEVGFTDIFGRRGICWQRASTDRAPDVLSML
jgi:hypothetical protein